MVDVYNDQAKSYYEDFHNKIPLLVEQQRVKQLEMQNERLRNPNSISLQDLLTKVLEDIEKSLSITKKLPTSLQKEDGDKMEID